MFNYTANNDLGQCHYDVRSNNHNLRLVDLNNQVATEQNTANSDVSYHVLQPVNYFHNDNHNANKHCVYDENYNLLPNNQGIMQQNIGNSDVLYHDLQQVNSNVVDCFHDNNYYGGQQANFKNNQQVNVVSHFDDVNYNQNQLCNYYRNNCLYDGNFDNNRFKGHQKSSLPNAVQLYDPTKGLCQQNELDLCYADVPQLSHHTSSFGK